MEEKTHLDEQHQQLPQLLLMILEWLVLVQAEGHSESIQSWCISRGGRRQQVQWEMISLVSAAGGEFIHAALR